MSKILLLAVGQGFAIFAALNTMIYVNMNNFNVKELKPIKNLPYLGSMNFGELPNLIGTLSSVLS